MSETATAPVAVTSIPSPPSVPNSSPSRIRVWLEYFQLLISVALVSAFLIWLLWGPGTKTGDQAVVSAPSHPSVELDAENRISVDLSSPLGQRLSLQAVSSTQVTEPLINVTGRVVASRRPGQKQGNDFWQFNSAELINTFSEWEKATADIQFSESQLKEISDLAVAKESALSKSVERLEKLVRNGTETERELATQKAELQQTQIQNRKEIYQAELAVKTAKREATTLSLQLSQSGFDPEQLHNATSDIDIVTAEVPEAMVDRVVVGQACTAKFFGIPDEEFKGKVATLSPVLSTDQRTLRVMFTLNDPRDRLRPGMFATIGLGTDPHPVLRIPAESVVHVGKTDYVLVMDSEGQASGASLANQNSVENASRVRLRAAPVTVSELNDGKVDVKEGITAGLKIVNDNAILLKPLVVTLLGRQAPDSAAGSNSATGVK